MNRPDDIAEHQNAMWEDQPKNWKDKQAEVEDEDEERSCCPNPLLAREKCLNCGTYR